MPNSLTLKNLNVEKLIDLIKSAQSVDNSVCIEIDAEKVAVQSAKPERNAVKVVSAPIAEMFDLLPKEIADMPHLVLPFMESKNVIDVLKTFSAGVENTAVFTYLERDGAFHVANVKVSEKKSLSITINCSEMQDIIYMAPEIVAKLTNTTDSVGSFELIEPTFKKVSSLFGLNRDEEHVKISSDGTNVYLIGKNYQYLLSELYTGEETNIEFSKYFFDLADKAYSTIVIKPRSIVISALDTGSVTVFGISI